MEWDRATNRKINYQLINFLGRYIVFDSFFFLFSFFDMSTQEGEGGIRTSDLRFMRHGPQPIELLFGN
jgi:hypothetical protein